MDDVEFFEFQAKGDDVFAERGEVVLVGAANLFDQAVNTKAFHRP